MINMVIIIIVIVTILITAINVTIKIIVIQSCKKTTGTRVSPVRKVHSMWGQWGRFIFEHSVSTNVKRTMQSTTWLMPNTGQ